MRRRAQRQIIAVYILQVMTLGLAGSLLGVAIARAAIAAIPLALGVVDARSSPRRTTASRWSAARRASAIGVLVSLLFSVVPLLARAVHQAVAAAARRGDAAPPRLDRPRRHGARVGWRWWRSPPGRRRRSRSAWSSAPDLPGWRWCCMLAGRRAGRAGRAAGNSRSFPLRHAVLHLSRPGNQTRVILLAVGLGAFFIVGVRSLQASLLERVLDPGGGRFAGHVPARHPEAAGRRRARVPRATRRTAPATSS